MRGVQLYSLGDFGVSMFGRATEAYDLAGYKVKLPRQSLYLGRAKLCEKPTAGLARHGQAMARP